MAEVPFSEEEQRVDPAQQDIPSLIIWKRGKRETSLSGFGFFLGSSMWGARALRCFRPHYHYPPSFPSLPFVEQLILFKVHLSSSLALGLTLLSVASKREGKQPAAATVTLYFIAMNRDVDRPGGHAVRRGVEPSSSLL